MSNPVLTLLLEPRSLVITTGALYTSHLHGIEPLTTDIFSPSPSDSPHLTVPDPDSRIDRGRIANLSMLADEHLSNAVRKGGELERRTRVSLTCRDVERVIGIQKFAPNARGRG